MASYDVASNFWWALGMGDLSTAPRYEAVKAMF